VIAGTVGGGGRVEFTVIGDVVNTAARVESATRETGDDVLITESCRALLKPGRFALEARGMVELKGKREQVQLWAPAPVAAPVPDEPPRARYTGETRPARIR
jgi:class 3 adenylate cyclase